MPAGEAIRVVPAGREPERPDAQRRLELFDAATARQAARQKDVAGGGGGERGWRRDELYARGRAG